MNPAPKKSRHLIGYLSKYLCRLQISLKRLLKCNSRQDKVGYKYNSHSSAKSEIDFISVINLTCRMIHQILPPKFKQIRYYGLQSPSNRNRLTAKVCMAVGRLILLLQIERRSIVTPRSTCKSLIELWWGENPLR